MSSEALLRCAM